MILVVDDEPELRELFAELLSLEGYRVRTAPNGKIALEHAGANRPDLILLDLMMPVMSGWQFLEAKRAAPELENVPVVIVTAGLDTHVEGAALLLRKPFDIETLLMIVARLAPRPGREHGRSAAPFSTGAATGRRD